MRKWLRRVRAAVVMGVAWAVVWAPVGVAIGLLVDPDGSMDEPWILIGAYPGFIGGVVFSAVLAIAARRRTLGELSLARVAAWGAAAGLLVGLVPFTVALSSGSLSTWLLASGAIGAFTLLGAGSAAGSLALARGGEARVPRVGRGS